MPSPTPAAERARQLAAIVNGPLKTLERAREAKAKADAKAKAADRTWRDAIAAALEADVAVNDVADAAGVHRSRVWQLTRKPATPATGQ